MTKNSFVAEVAFKKIYSIWAANISTISFIVLTKTRNDLKPPETIWNHLNLPETTQKLPETSHIIVFFT